MTAIFRIFQGFFYEYVRGVLPAVNGGCDRFGVLRGKSRTRMITVFLPSAQWQTKTAAGIYILIIGRRGGLGPSPVLVRNTLPKRLPAP